MKHLRNILLFTFILFFASACFNSSRLNSGLLGRLSHRGPVSISKENPYLRGNLLISEEAKQNPVMAGFIEEQGWPDALEVKTKPFKPVSLLFYYKETKEFYSLEELKDSWYIDGPFEIDQETYEALDTKDISSTNTDENISTEAQTGLKSETEKVNDKTVSKISKEKVKKVDNKKESKKTDTKKSDSNSEKIEPSIKKEETRKRDHKNIKDNSSNNIDSSKIKSKDDHKNLAKDDTFINIKEKEASEDILEKSASKKDPSRNLGDKLEKPSDISESKKPGDFKLHNKSIPSTLGNLIEENKSSKLTNNQQLLKTDNINNLRESAKGKPAETTPKGDIVHYVTYPGETLSMISRWYTDERENAGRIARINKLARPDKLELGDTVVIPSYLVKNKNRLTESAVKSLVIEAKKVKTGN